jgi:hypothetical protein
MNFYYFLNLFLILFENPLSLLSKITIVSDPSFIFFMLNYFVRIFVFLLYLGFFEWCIVDAISAARRIREQGFAPHDSMIRIDAL